jgi:hypothetical protein
VSPGTAEEPDRSDWPERPQTRRCRKCPAQIVILQGPEGNPIPAQPVRSVYVLQEDGTIAKMANHAGPLYVNHYETCPRADDFHQRQRTAGRGEVEPPPA